MHVSQSINGTGYTLIYTYFLAYCRPYVHFPIHQIHIIRLYIHIRVIMAGDAIVIFIENNTKWYKT